MIGMREDEFGMMKKFGRRSFLLFIFQASETENEWISGKRVTSQWFNEGDSSNDGSSKWCA